MERMVKDLDILDHSFIPKHLPGRENELVELNKLLKYCNQVSRHINLQGKSGTGKTATVNKVCKDLLPDLKKKNVKIDYFYVNCKDKKTKFDSLKTICKQMCNGNKVPNTWSQLYDLFIEKIKNFDAIIVFLDEIDALAKRGEDELDILYTLSRLKAHGYTNCNISVVIATNKVDFVMNLDSGIKSSFRTTSLLYKPYTTDILQKILEDRAQMALHSGVLNDDVIPLCSAFAAQEHGDARKAIDLLRTSVEVALDSDSKKVTIKHVKDARVRIEEDKTSELISYLPMQHKIILLSVLNIAKKRIRKPSFNNNKATTGDIYAQYLSLSKQIRIEATTQRWVSGILSEMDGLGLLNVDVVSKGRYGRTKFISVPMQGN